MTTYRRLFSYVRPYRYRLMWSILFGLLVSGATALSALLVKPVLDDIFVARDTTKLLLLPLAIVLLYAARGIFQYGHTYLMRSIGQRVIRDLRQHLYRHILDMPLSYFQAHHTGVLMSRVTHDITLMQRAVSNTVHDVLRQGLTMAGLIGVAFYRDWVLASVAVVVLPLAGVPIVVLGRRLRRLSWRAQEKMGALSAQVEDSLSGMKIVKGFGREAYEGRRFQQRNHDYYRVTMRAVRTSAISSPIMECLGALGVATVVWYGGHQVIAGSTTPGTFFSFMTAILMLYEPMRKLSRVNSTLQAAMAAADRVFTVLDANGEYQDEADKMVLPPMRHELVFHHVCMRYGATMPLVLRHVDLRVKAGEVVALVGASGAGKTSLVDLIPRFYDPIRGAITIDGVDIRCVGLDSLRAQIALVTQEVILFDDTVRQNILYGNPAASEQQVMAAARAAYAHAFIMRMPEGYDTVIGARGVRLSGGEKQRIAIARALLKDPPILILDEATSALDNQSEQMVQHALDNLMKDRTTLVIAHRLSTVRHADKIVVLHQGTIVEIGRHEQLLAQEGYYRWLYETQFQASGSHAVKHEPLLAVRDTPERAAGSVIDPQQDGLHA